MIPAASQLWTPVDPLPLSTLHPASRVGAGVLAVLTALLAPPPLLLPLAMVIAWLLHRGGLQGAGLGGWLRAWWPVALVIVAIHTLTTTAAAPLGQPSLTGALRGGLALARLAVMLGSMALLSRVLPLPDLVVALGWWLRPLRRLGVDTRHLGVTLAVALGTAPRTQAEAGRILACMRLRTADGRPRRGLRLRERLRVVPPLMEGLARRGETLPLALAGRLPRAEAPLPRLPWSQGLVLLAWIALLVLASEVRP